MELRGKTCLITGGTRGIGAAAAIAFAEQGANCALVARRLDEAAEQTRQRIETSGSKCLLISADMGKAGDATQCVAQTAEGFGSVDVLVHAAGGPVNGRLMEITPEIWHEAFNVHVHAIFHLCRAAIPFMKQKKEGAIVLVSSVAGIRALKVHVAYQAVKGAVPQLARALAYEFADDNIRVNCVAPGIVRTEFHAAMPPAVRQYNLENRVPLHREGTPEQVGSLIRELATNDYVTGETFTIDGGLTMRIC
jgi:NAD(P)-dependent dehydrogenase (short-subunit alcohol dehydrogenase family)